MSARVIATRPLDMIKAVGVDLHMSEPERTMLVRCLVASLYVWVGMYDEDIYCVWGVIPPTILSNRAYIWLHTEQTRVVGHQFVFIRHSQLAVKNMLEKFDVLYGTADKRNEKTVRWLKWLGAEFEYAPSTMLDFVIRRK